MFAFDKDNIPEKIVEGLQPYIESEDFDAEEDRVCVQGVHGHVPVGSRDEQVPLRGQGGGAEAHRPQAVAGGARRADAEAQQAALASSRRRRGQDRGRSRPSLPSRLRKKEELAAKVADADGEATIVRAGCWAASAARRSAGRRRSSG